MKLRSVCLLLSAFAAETTLGRGVSPYLPLELAPEIERQVERVLLYADQPILTRPIAAATVLDALPAACEIDAALCAEVRRYLNGFMKTAGFSHASAAVYATSDDAVPLPNRHGIASDSSFELSLAGYWQPHDKLLVSAGVLAFEDETVPTGSLVSVGFEYAQFDAGFRDHWFSPLSESSMLIGTQAQTMPSLTVSNYTPLTRFNLRYEMFVAEMSESSSIRFADRFTVGKPRLAGMHLSIEPLPGWSIGVNRIMQFGGGERGGRSLRDVFDAFFDPSGSDNFGGNLTRDEEFGNQAASITSKILIPGKKPFSVYLEYAGEDTSALSNVRLGNVAMAGGVHFPNVWRGLELTFELSEWQNGWYVHGIYQDGLSNEGNVLGHWGADWRVRGDNVGARATMLRLGWQPRFGGWLETTLRTLGNEAYSSNEYQDARLFEAQYSRGWRDFRLGLDLAAGEDSFGESFSRFGAFMRF